MVAERKRSGTVSVYGTRVGMEEGWEDESEVEEVELELELESPTKRRKLHAADIATSETNRLGLIGEDTSDSAMHPAKTERAPAVPVRDAG